MGQEQYDRQTEWGTAHGLHPTNESLMPCPRFTVGKRCLFLNLKKRMIHGEYVECVCQHSRVRTLSDHVRKWRIKDGKGIGVLVYEPYHVDPQALNDLRAIMLDLGIRVWETGESAWEDGTNILVLARAEVTAEDLGL